MAKKIKIELVDAGIRALLNSPEIQGKCDEVAEGILHRAGDGYAMESTNWPTRKIRVVHTTDIKSARSNLKHNTLLKAMEG